MPTSTAIGRPLLVLSMVWICCGLSTALPVFAACQGESCRILVVGDMGIGDNAFTAGFLAVQQAMIQDAPDLVLYVGDYIYTKSSCTGDTPAGEVPRYVAEVRDKLIEPFQGQVVFSRGDNDAPTEDGDWAKAADTCWKIIAGWGMPLTKPPGAREWEGLLEDQPGVCAPGEARWKPENASIWPGGAAMLACHSTSLGTSVFDHFELHRSR